MQVPTMKIHRAIMTQALDVCYTLIENKHTKTTFWTEGQDRPFSKIPVHPGNNDDQQFCLFGSNFLLSFLDLASYSR